MPSFTPSTPALPHRRPIRGLLTPAVAACLLAVWPIAQADTIWLNNGDRLTGTIKSLDGGVLLVGTAYGGDIRVKFDQVKTCLLYTSPSPRDS